ncbi:E3 ubiquitin-protein ligase RGLG5-like [Impatiens glandulifera]|uniref:E3 ubiquitin-protein ligase RGLG5-like n=1 Tax=Impatiens glandulifera TaxID=253017 RepID=UPI001FB0624A|nr:E3 ubiquitin-protein ligase RGLG5-like [Impatiens glandulifera]
MGSTSSKETTSPRQFVYSSYSNAIYQPASLGQNPNYTQQVKLDKKYQNISDNYQTLEQVIAALAHSGLESSNLIIGIDFTKSNEWTGSRSFKRRCLHHIGDGLNPYEEAISIVGKTLSSFDEDNLIPCFGFGDASTHDEDVFSFNRDGTPCNGFEGVLSRYREIVPHLKLSGPTSFAPLIETAMKIVDESYGQYHVLLIIADGQVTRSANTPNGQLSRQETQTIDAIVRASEYPLSIVLVGVGDGPWDIMNEFDDNIPARAFDNFQFVNFTEIMSRNIDPLKKEAEFALAALMEIPSQYKATLELNLLGRKTGRAPNKVSLPPPISTLASFGSYSIPRHFDLPAADNDPSLFSWDDNLVCPICLVHLKDMAFGCGHQTCCDCAETLDTCPICRRDIYTKIKLYR